MPATPAAHPHADRPTFEYRVRFPGRLTNAVVVPADEAVVPRPRPAPAPVPVPQPPPPAPPAPAPVPAPAAAASPPAPPTPADPPPPAPVDPAEFWKTDIARELATDRQRIETAVEQLRAAVAGYREDQAGRLREWQRAAVELASTIAARVMHQELRSGDFPMEEKVRGMVAQLEGEAAVTVRLNPDDLSLLESRLGGEQLLPGGTDPRLVPDPTLGRGECRVEGRESMLLSDVTRELAEIRDELLRSLGHARP